MDWCASFEEVLGNVLYGHIKDEFPALVDELRTSVTRCRESLDALGPSRQTMIQQRQYLSELAVKYQNVVTASLQGNYNETRDTDDIRKLRMHIRVENERFTEKLRTKGHSRAFQTSDDTAEENLENEPYNGESIYDWIRQTYREYQSSQFPGTVNPMHL